MKRAVISDIHGNLEALQSVLAHIADQQVDEIFCLGDIIGYGPNPCECLDLVIEKAKICLLVLTVERSAPFSGRETSSKAVRAHATRLTAAGTFWAPYLACIVMILGCLCMVRRATQ